MIYQNEDLLYNSLTGGMIWARNSPCSVTPNSNGYLPITWNQHRLAWYLVHGEFPDREIDHKDGRRANNKLSNLRLVDQSGQRKNSKLQNNNSSGMQGISWSKNANKWEVYIHNNCKKIHLGLFNTFEDAVKVRKSAEIKYNYHLNHGRTN